MSRKSLGLGFVIGLISVLVSCQQEQKAKVSPPDDIYHTSFGEGPPIILIHGGPGLGSTYLEESFKSLSEDFTLIIYDQRNSGRSPLQTDTSRVRLSAFLNDISHLLDFYGQEKATVIGHSWGGLLAMKYALSSPERVHKLILINSNTADSDLNNQANTKLANRFSADDIEAMTRIRRTEAFLNEDPKAYEEMMQIGFSYQFDNPNLIRGLKLDLPDDFGRKSQQLGNLFKDLGTYNFTNDLSGIKAPTLLLYGLRDPLTPYALNSMGKVIPLVTTKVIENTGHFPFIEDREATISAISVFLKERE